MAGQLTAFNRGRLDLTEVTDNINTTHKCQKECEKDLGIISVEDLETR